MKETNFIFRLSDLLNYVGKSILFVGLITFSGLIPESSISNAQPTQTELSEARSAFLKKTFSLEKVFGFSVDLVLPSNSKINFTYCLHHYRNKIALKLVGTSKELPTFEREGFLIYYATSQSAEFHTDQQKG
ncbi:MAG: hypothetical protein EBR30_12450 [Cytophagia bacterium]|nr:hypothetical protein [Cytophagia bacterium]